MGLCCLKVGQFYLQSCATKYFKPCTNPTNHTKEPQLSLVADSQQGYRMNTGLVHYMPPKCTESIPHASCSPTTTGLPISTGQF